MCTNQFDPNQLYKLLVKQYFKSSSHFMIAVCVLIDEKETASEIYIQLNCLWLGTFYGFVPTTE